MRAFVCVLDPEGRGIGERTLHQFASFARRRELNFMWHRTAYAAVLTAGRRLVDDSLVVFANGRVAAGAVRLDNRAEVSRAAGLKEVGQPDLAVLLAAVERHGEASVSEFLGDFAFVTWSSTTREALAACDALAVRKLYYGTRDDLIAFASHAEALDVGERYDVQFLAEQVAGCEGTPDLSLYQGVKAVPAGCLVQVSPRGIFSRRYWSPEAFAQYPTRPTPVNEQVEQFRNLFVEAVRSRLPETGGTWAQLSGGLDSSSVASVAQWLAATGGIGRGLDGTVTYVDRQATAADEREYSDAVVRRWQLRNETIVDPPMWYDERHAPPHLDQPRPNFMFYPRECRLCGIVRQSGAHVLLTGQGPDEYLRGSMFFFADWIARGRVAAAVREMVRRAAIGRVSFWDLAYQNAIVPLLPSALRRRLGPAVTRLPEWIRPTIARRYELHRRNYEFSLYSGQLGQKYRHSMIRGVEVLAATMGHLVLDDHLDVRHPFLDRRLVEYSLGLPAELTTRPYAGKWVLREAMRGIVPEVVRTRVGKGTQVERHAWALASQRPLLEPLVREPALAELGIIDATKLRTAFDEIISQPYGRNDPHAALEQVLAIEACLQVRAGRWPRGPLQ